MEEFLEGYKPVKEFLISCGRKKYLARTLQKIGERQVESVCNFCAFRGCGCCRDNKFVDMKGESWACNRLNIHGATGKNSHYYVIDEYKDPVKLVLQTPEERELVEMILG